MNRRNIIVLAAAAVIALLAVFLVNAWFSGVEKQQTQAAARPMTKVVVASQGLSFGTPLTNTNVRLADWPQSSVPTGAFRSIPDALRGDRVALRPIEVGEPVLAERVSGPDGHASIAANIPGDMRAVSISVSAVTGVGGFVTPGDVVDIFLTRDLNDGSKVTSVVLENTQVLAVDQRADEKKAQPKVSKTATFLTNLDGAQKLVLASHMGTLSLALRNVQNQTVGAAKAVTARDLGGPYIASRPAPMMRSQPAYVAPAVATAVAAPPRAIAPRVPSGPSMTVYRGVTDAQYEVPRYGVR
jgi:pilus assembly protein CpaB